jgi:hypothetical protein
LRSVGEGANTQLKTNKISPYMKKREYEVVTFTLSKRLRRILKQYAQLKKKPMSEIVERALYEYFLRRKPTRQMLEQQ